MNRNTAPGWFAVSDQGFRIPATLLVAQLCDGALLLQGSRDGASAYVIPQDADPLRHALATAFGSTDQPQS